MNPTTDLHSLGQRLWLDNITRDLLVSGTLQRYVRDFNVSGLTSNPTIFDHAIRNTNLYDDAIRGGAAQGRSGEALFLDLALADVTTAADLFRPIYDSTAGIDGWASLEVSPLLANDAAATVRETVQLHARAQRPNLFIKIPGTRAGVTAIEESIFAGVPVNVTLLFSREQYLAAAEAYLRGVERRIAAGLDPKVASVASIFVSRWDVAVKNTVPEALRNRLGIAIAKRAYKAYRELLASPRWRKLAALGARPQRLLWASTGTKDPAAPDTLYIEALAAPDTINTLPDKTLLAFADHGKLRGELPVDGGDAEATLAEFARAGVDNAALAEQLLREGTQSFDKSWASLMECIASKARVVGNAAAARRTGDTGAHMSTRTAHARWEGTLKDGKGEIDFGHGRFKGPYSFASRFEEGAGTNPEELLGAAHAGCFAMALSLMLSQAGFKPDYIDATAHVTVSPHDGGFKITRSHLVCEAKVSGIDEAQFSKYAAQARSGCPVSQALAGIEITFEAKLR